MKTSVHGRNMEVTDWIREYVEKKVGKLERYLPEAKEARSELTHTDTRSAQDRYTAQLTIWTDGRILRAEESTGDVFASVDATVDKMYRQIERYKGRRYHEKRRQSAAAVANAQAEAIAQMEEDSAEEAAQASFGGEIVRVKEFAVQPMSEREAVDQMELLGHDFFLFYNVDADGINVVYRRRDENYGLLKPVMA